MIGREPVKTPSRIARFSQPRVRLLAGQCRRRLDEPEPSARFESCDALSTDSLISLRVELSSQRSGKGVKCQIPAAVVAHGR